MFSNNPSKGERTTGQSQNQTTYLEIDLNGMRYSPLPSKLKSGKNYQSGAELIGLLMINHENSAEIHFTTSIINQLSA